MRTDSNYSASKCIQKLGKHTSMLRITAMTVIFLTFGILLLTTPFM